MSVKPNAINDDRRSDPAGLSGNCSAIKEATVLRGAKSDHPTEVTLPITKVTAIVSPNARPIPKTIAPIIPLRDHGAMIFHMTSQRVAPSPYALSRSIGGTAPNTSHITAVMKGAIITARTMPDVITPVPIGGPFNNGPKINT
ncbi:hypothetical protein AA15669_1027 [Saccharibacter floricola DSM 15669]|uniref:Tox-PAAR-like domain-containing protein n=1 Tax=Saccharibacter floricola DSM 15669 TaxID=1123227 RepID=A0ABQ0NYS8_9PROT|nr:hypothetical protein AA15669_1027 [Saccharibacter floricola DSM 15669]